jgi:putative glutamine amidotransferase
VSTRARPLVALTTSWDAEGGSHRQPQVILYEAYVRALEEAGLAAVLVSPAHSASSIASLMERCDGLVLTGGGDVDPARYGERVRHTLDSVSAERDATEFAALGAAIEQKVPVLGICRGIQLMNVYLGGTLYQDIDAEHPGTAHRHSEQWGTRAHHVNVLPGSKLRAIVGREALHINSFHHQAIKQVAPSLAVTALAEDGLIEAVEMKDYPFGLGVQWHPERHEASAPRTDPDKLLFAAFAAAVAERRAMEPARAG